MSAGQINVPIVFRGPNGAAAGVGAQHSQVSPDVSFNHLTWTVIEWDMKILMHIFKYSL